MNTIYRLGTLLWIVALLGCSQKVQPLDTANIHTAPIIADHTSTDLSQIPFSYLSKAMSEFGIAFGHTSHGSQVISGMMALEHKNEKYAFAITGSDKVLTLFDRRPKGDLGNPNRSEWSHRTRKRLDNGREDINIVMWSWCGQVSHASEEDINLYLDLMQALEKDYPGVVFVYMTGHLDGNGKKGNLHQRNEQIRQFCIANNKVLFDFADIERYDPDGNDFLDKNADDGCYYHDNGIKKNWAIEWCDRNEDKCSYYRCAHSEALNCDRKAVAFWWLIARIAGWSPTMKDLNVSYLPLTISINSFKFLNEVTHFII